MLNCFISIHCRLRMICHVLNARICLKCSLICSVAAKAMTRKMKMHFQHGFSLFIYEVRFKRVVQVPSQMLVPQRKWSLILYSHPRKGLNSPSCPPKQPQNAAGDAESKYQAFFWKGLNITNLKFKYNIVSKPISKEEAHQDSRP